MTEKKERSSNAGIPILTYLYKLINTEYMIQRNFTSKNYSQNYELRTTNYELRTTNYELRTTNYELRTTNYELRTTNYENYVACINLVKYLLNNKINFLIAACSLLNILALLKKNRLDKIGVRK
jgi:hypothetical protein